MYKKCRIAISSLQMESFIQFSEWCYDTIKNVHALKQMSITKYVNLVTHEFLLKGKLSNSIFLLQSFSQKFIMGLECYLKKSVFFAHKHRRYNWS